MKQQLTFADFDFELKQLNDRIKEKALKIANEYYLSGTLSKEEALQKGIVLAEEWWLDVEG